MIASYDERNGGWWILDEPGGRRLGFFHESDCAGDDGVEFDPNVYPWQDGAMLFRYDSGGTSDTNELGLRYEVIGVSAIGEETMLGCFDDVRDCPEILGVQGFEKLYIFDTE